MSLKILVIGHDCTRAPGCRQMLDPAEYDVHCFPDPLTGVQAAIAGGFDGILVDEAQASPGAWDILRQLKDANVPAQVIVLSPAGTIETAVAAIKEGAADYLKEPSTPQELHAILRRFEPPSATAADPQPEGLAGGASRGFEGI